MIADVSGFTALTEALGSQGSAGVELLTKCMNRYFTQVRAACDVCQVMWVALAAWPLPACLPAGLPDCLSFP